jgi:hypothetical protein
VPTYADVRARAFPIRQENTLNLLDAALGPAIKPLVPEKQKAADQLSAVHKKIRETLAFQRYAHLARVEC